MKITILLLALSLSSFAAKKEKVTCFSYSKKGKLKEKLKRKCNSKKWHKTEDAAIAATKAKCEKKAKKWMWVKPSNQSQGMCVKKSKYAQMTHEELEKALIETKPNTEKFDQIMAEYKDLESKRDKKNFRKKLNKITARRLKRSDRKWPGPRLVCVYSGAAAVVNVTAMNCTNFKGEKYLVSIIGIGPSVNLQAGVGILKSKTNKLEGTYNYSSAGLNIGLGVYGGSESKTKLFKISGFGIGAGYELAISKIIIERK